MPEAFSSVQAQVQGGGAFFFVFFFLGRLCLGTLVLALATWGRHIPAVEILGWEIKYGVLRTACRRH